MAGGNDAQPGAQSLHTYGETLSLHPHVNGNATAFAKPMHTYDKGGAAGFKQNAEVRSGGLPHISMGAAPPHGIGGHY